MMPSICTITRVTIAAMFALMVAVSCTSSETATDETATDMPTTPPPTGTGDPSHGLLDINEPFDATEQASRERFATQITHTTFRPDWLYVTPLTDRVANADGQFDTPQELKDRRFITPAFLPPPDTDTFEAAVTQANDTVIARSTWHDGCPIAKDELAYVTVTFYGFDQVVHSGELLVHRDVAEAVVSVFRRLYDARFPIEEMRIIRQDELDAEPTGDGNVTTGFVCRSVVSGTAWSEHAYGRAIDINPFHNPYLRGTQVIPELATAYLDRDNVRPGMIVDGDVVVTAFRDIGWPWGGNWRSAKDWMHFSSTGR